MRYWLLCGMLCPWETRSPNQTSIHVHDPPPRRWPLKIDVVSARDVREGMGICLDLVSLQFLEGALTDVHTGETLKNFGVRPGDVVSADRGYAHAAGMAYAVAQGAALIVRLNPFSVVLCDPAGQPLSLGAALQRQPAETIRTLPVVIRASSGDDVVREWVHAYRVSAAQANAARRKCRQRHKKGAPKAATLFLAGWVLVVTTLAPEVLSASTILALYRAPASTPGHRGRQHRCG